MSHTVSRRQFMRATAAGIGLTTLSATSYARILGANERISIGIIGCGDRGINVHMKNIHALAASQNVEITAVADPWKPRREKAGALIKEHYGRNARQFVSHRDLLALKDVDAVVIVSCDHQHTTHLQAAAEAGKDAYCEKPMATDLSRLNRAYDAVKKAGSIVQIGTQLRSYPSFTGCQKLYKTGILGKVARIEQRRNTTKPYWYNYIRDVKQSDVDWQEFLMHNPPRPFDPVVFSGWYGYRGFSDGPVPGLASHFLDLVQYITGATFPSSCVCLGGTYTWKDKYNFTCPDQVQALWEYPEGFMVSYSTNFGSSADNSFKIIGDQGLMDMTNWNSPFYSAEGGSKKAGVIRGKNPVKPIERPDHWLNWLQCLRTRETPHASIDDGYAHGVATLMAVQSYDTGKRMIYDKATRRILPG
jgi:predicted dehydrogenase